MPECRKIWIELSVVQAEPVDWAEFRPSRSSVSGSQRARKFLETVFALLVTHIESQLWLGVALRLVTILPHLHFEECNRVEQSFHSPLPFGRKTEFRNEWKGKINWGCLRRKINNVSFGVTTKIRFAYECVGTEKVSQRIFFFSRFKRVSSQLTACCVFRFLSVSL